MNLKQLKSLNDTEFIAKCETKYKSKIPKKIRRKLKKALKKRKRLEQGIVRNNGQWRRAVLIRDDYTCQDCGRRSRHNHAHHIKLKSEYPELRLVISNGKTLCRDCHDKVHHGLIEYYQQQSILRDMAHSV